MPPVVVKSPITVEEALEIKLLTVKSPLLPLILRAETVDVPNVEGEDVAR